MVLDCGGDESRTIKQKKKKMKKMLKYPDTDINFYWYVRLNNPYVCDLDRGHLTLDFGGSRAHFHYWQSV